MSRLMTYFRRYAFQEVAATAAAIVCGALLCRAGRDSATISLSCALVEFLVFYGLAFVRARPCAVTQGRGTFSTLADLLREYGPSELVDLVVRPGSMYVGMACTANPILGLLLGTVFADVVFYIGAAWAFERSRSASPKAVMARG